MIVRSVEDLRAVVAKKAGTREFYRAAVLGLPWSFSCPLHPPVKAAEFLSAWPEVRAWAQAWLRPSPYWTVETTVRQVGRGTRVGQSTLPHFPSRVCIASVEQALGFLRDEKAFQAYAHAVRPLVTAFPALEPVCLTPAFRKAVEEEPSLPAALLEVARYFAEGSRTDCYLRELDIPHVDTKFIERHRDLTARVFSALYPDRGVKDFASLCGHLHWHVHPVEPYIYVRSLDPSLTFGGMSVCQVTAEQLAMLRVPVARVFVTENKVNGAVFPHVKGAIILYGAGKSITGPAMDQVSWLHAVPELDYWGDLDRDGFDMLSRFRAMFPQTRSMLMTEAVFSRCREFAVLDEGTAAAEPPARLTDEEQSCWHALQASAPGGMRLEQEKIPMHELTSWLAYCIRRKRATMKGEYGKGSGDIVFGEKDEG